MREGHHDELCDGGDSKELEKETQALQVARNWLSDKAEMQSWDAATEAIAIGADEVEVDLRQPKDAAGQPLSWGDVRRMPDAGQGATRTDSEPDRKLDKTAVDRDG